jgi:hypothetical protein
MWKNIVDPDRPQTIRRMHTACWITKAAGHTHSIFTYFLLLSTAKWLYQDALRHNTPSSSEYCRRNYCSCKAQCGLKFNKRHWLNTNKNNKSNKKCHWESRVFLFCWSPFYFAEVIHASELTIRLTTNSRKQARHDVIEQCGTPCNS